MNPITQFLTNILNLLLGLFGINLQKEENDDKVPEEIEVENNNNMKKITLIRKYEKGGTVGLLVFPSGETMYVLERPKESEDESPVCIPEGTYPLVMRESPIVKSTSKGKYTRGYEVTEVEGRTHIMVHIGNYVHNSEGCLLTGESVGKHKGLPAVWKSAVAFDRFMKLMQEEEITHIEIKSE